MKATFVVHEAKATPGGRNGSMDLVLRPVVNETQTNRDWSPGSSPTGELRLTMTNGELAKKLAVGQRLELTMELVEPPTAATATAAEAMPAETVSTGQAKKNQ